MPFERGGTHEDHNTKENTISFQSNNLELRLGISSSDNSCSNNMACSKAMNSTVKGFSCSTSTSNIAPAVLYQSSTSSSSVLGLGGGGSYMGFPQSPLGFVHPWSLAARQQKAAIEQAHHQKPNNLASASASASVAVASSSLSRAEQLPPLAAVVGWPPVREFRRNLVSTNLPKSAMDDHEKGAMRAKSAAENINNDDDNNNNIMKRRTESRPTMFVKVNMEGYVVGRKINLRAHDSYESLSRAVRKMFSNFLSTTYFNNSGEEEDEDVADPDFILLYEDHEGDRMLVGDVPWELFITSVKRLYIAHNRKMQENGNGSVADDDDQHMKKQLNEVDK